MQDHLLEMILILLVPLEPSDYKVGGKHLVVWRSVIMAGGGQCVMTAGTALMLVLPADNLDFPQMELQLSDQGL
jgi:hypothetical protein